MKKSSIVVGIILLTSLIFIANSNSVSAATGELLISEVLYDTPGTDSAEEWVEIFNPGTSAIDLSGYTIEDNVGSFALSGTINAGGHFVVASQTAGFNALYGQNPDQSGMSLALGNSGDFVKLFNGVTLVDQVGWENGLTGWTISAVHVTIERIDNIADNPTSWQNSGSIGNPGTSGLTGGGLDYVIIDQVYYDTIGTDSVEEYVQLFNPTNSAIDLSSYTISDGEATFSLSGSVASGDVFVVARDNTGFFNLFGFQPDQTGMTLALANGGDSVSLDDGSGEIDFVAWEGNVAGWTISASIGDMLERQGVDTDTEADWLAVPANPGQSQGGGGDPPGPDTENPVVSITSPADTATVYRRITISTSSSDNVGVTSQSISIDGNVVATTSSYSWDTETVIDGTYAISTTVFDAAGNSASDSISVNVDNANAPPLPAIGEVKIMAYNIENSGLNADWLEVVKEENADILILVETGSWDDAGNDDVMLGYCNQLNTYFSSFGEDPYNCVQTMGVPYGTSGEAVFSRYPVTTTSQIALLTLDDSSTHDPSHDFLDATIDIGGQDFHFIASHLKCCGGTANEDKRIAQQEGIINYMDGLGDVPIVYAGDLNSFSPEDTENLGDLMYHPMSMMLEDTTYGDLSSKYSTIHTWDDPLTTLKPGQFFPTYGHQNSIYTSRIDFIVVNHWFDTLNYVDATVGDTASAQTGSDHYSTDFTYNFGDGDPVGDTTPPSQVDGVIANSVSDSQIDISWNAASDDVGVVSYNIYRDSINIGNSAGLSFSDTGLLPDTTYSYTVSALDLAGNEGSQSVATMATTLATPDTTPPDQVTGLSATTVSDSEIYISWNVATDNVAVDYYNVYRNSVLYTTTAGTTLNDIGLIPDTQYTYEVSAVDSSGNEGALSVSASATTNVSPDTSPPSQVTGLIATSNGETSISLLWNAATDNIGVTGYNIYRDGTYVGSSTTESFTDNGLTASTSYSYTVEAYDEAGNVGLLSTPNSATTDDPPTQGLDYIIISEVHYHSSSRDRDGEWIEIYNPTGSQIDLAGYYIQDGNSGNTFSLSGTIGAGEFLVIARNVNGFTNIYGFAPDMGGWNFGLGNKGDAVSLHDGTGQEVDKVSWEGFEGGFDIEASKGQSIVRTNLTVDTDTVADWSVITIETPGY